MPRKPRYKFLRLRKIYDKTYRKGQLTAIFKDTTYKKPKREKGGWQVFNPDEGTSYVLPFMYSKKR